MTSNREAASPVQVGTLGDAASKPQTNHTINRHPVQLTPDLDQARRHLLLLDESETDFVFQTFDDIKTPDGKKRGDKTLTRVLHGTLDQCAGQLTSFNKRGAGIFVTINHSSNGRRKKEDIGGCRAIFREADEPNLPALPLEPHLVIESSPGKRHEYLMIERTDDFETWDGIMNTMVTVYGSDPNAQDRCRVLRLAGFFHQKDLDNPHMVKIVHESGARPFMLAEATRTIPPTAKAKEGPTAPTVGMGSKYGLAALARELATLKKTPEGRRNDQLNKAAFALSQLAAGGELDQRLVEKELLSTAMEIGLSEAEARSTIKSGLNSGLNEPRRAPAGMTDEEWPEHPVGLDLPDLPSFTANDFSPILWDMVSAVSKFTETPPELAGLLGLAVTATACQRRMVIEPTPGYREPLNIWTLTALGPGNRKSAVLTTMLSPLTEWEIDQAESSGPIIKAAQLQRANQEARLKAIQKQFARETDATKLEDFSKEMEEINSNLVEIPVKPQLATQDVTPERLGTLMASQGECMAAFSAEGGIFDIIAGRYSSGNPNLDIFLQSHSGDSVRVDRASRESVWLTAPAFTMGLCVQPDVIKSLVSKPGFRGRGLVARFLFALPKSPLGQRTLETKSIPADIEYEYKRIIRAMLEMPQPAVQSDIPVIELSPGAVKVWKDFQRWVETRLAEGGEFSHMQDWAGKLPGAAARIAGLFHCFEHAGKKPHAYPVSLETMGRALSLGKKLSRHVLAVYDLMEADADIVAARKILKWITRTGAASFTGHDCHAALKGTFRKRPELDPGLKVLVEYGYIRRVEAVGAKGPGRPPGRYDVRPANLPGV